MCYNVMMFSLPLPDLLMSSDTVKIISQSVLADCRIGLTQEATPSL